MHAHKRAHTHTHTHTKVAAMGWCIHKSGHRLVTWKYLMIAKANWRGDDKRLLLNKQHYNWNLYICNEWHSFHARVGRFSPFLYLRSVALLYLWSVAIAVILFWLQLVVLVSPCFLGSRIPRDYRFPRAPLFLCSERKSSSLTTGSSKL